MGLVSSLLNLGIRVEQAVSQVGVRLGKVPLQWPAGEDTSLIYRLPRDPHQRSSLFAETQPIVVNEGETAVVLEDGKAQGGLDPGRYVFERARIVGSLDILWIKTGQRMLKWGVGNVTSGDGIQISANGVIYTRVTNPVAFNTEMVQGATKLPDAELQRLLMPRLQGVLRPVISGWRALDLQRERNLFTDAIREALTESLTHLGLAILDFEVIEIGLPAEFKELVAQATLSQHQATAELLRAQTRSQVTQIEATGAAQAQLVSGMAQIQLMTTMQAQGIDPLRLKALEALNTFAATPSTAGLLAAGDPAKTALFGQLAAAALTTEAVSPGKPLGAVVVSPASEVEPSPQGPVTAALGDGSMSAPETAAEINRQIDRLTERLAEGLLSEETYTKLVARLEAKLAVMGGDKVT